MKQTRIMKRIASAVLFVSLATLGADQSAPVPIEEEPHHHLVLKNDYVQVFHTTVAPGESTLFHVHLHDNAGVELSTRTTTDQLLGKSEGAPSVSRAGEVFANSRLQGPTTHRVHNVGSTTMDVIDVEFFQRPEHALATAAAPVAAENASARVYSWVLAPGAVSAMHSHERPYLIVAVTPMHLKMTAPDGRSFTDDVKPGDFHWVDAKVTHTLENAGTTPGQLVEFEMK